MALAQLRSLTDHDPFPALAGNIICNCTLVTTDLIHVPVLTGAIIIQSDSEFTGIDGYSVLVGSLTVTPQGGVPQALAGTITCQLQFDYTSGAPPNDSSPLNVAHTLQGSITDQLIFSPFGGILNDASSLTIAHTLQGSIVGALIFTYTSSGQLIDQCSLTVAHTIASNVATQVNITGGTVDAITAQSSVACLAVLSAQLAVAHTLQGNIADQLIFTPNSGGILNDSSNLAVAHTLLSLITISSSFSGSNNLNETSQTGVTDVNVFSGFLNVNHPLAGSVITILGFTDSFATVAHTLQGTIAGQLIFTYTSGGQLIDESSLIVAHTLNGEIDDSLGASITAGLSVGGAINNSGIVSGNLTVAWTLQGIIDCYCHCDQDSQLICDCEINGSLTTAHALQSSITSSSTLSGSNNLNITDNGGVNDALIFKASDLPVSHTLQGEIDDVLVIISILNVNHPLSGEIDDSTGFTVSLSGGGGGGGTIIASGVIVGSLSVDHPLISSIICSSNFNGSNNVNHPIDNSGINDALVISSSDLPVVHTLLGGINCSTGLSANLGTSGGGVILSSGTIIGSLGVNHTLQGIVDCYSHLDQGSGILCDCELTGTLSFTRAISGSIICSTGLSADISGQSGNGGNSNSVGTITGSLGVSHSLQGEEDDSLSINDRLNNGVGGNGTINNNSTITVDLGVNHTLLGNVSIVEAGLGNLLTGNNGEIDGTSVIIGSLTNNVSLQGNIDDSSNITTIGQLNQQGSVEIDLGCGIIGSLSVGRAISLEIDNALVMRGTISAGASTFAFPGDFIVLPRKNIWLFAPIKNTLFGGFKRIIRLYVPSKPRKL